MVRLDQLSPMLLTSGSETPREGGWAFELKWDGMRTVCCVSGGSVQVRSRHGTDFTAAFPELQGLAGVLKSRVTVLDGELVCAGDDGRPSFSRIRRRWAPSGARSASRLARECPAAFVAFDVLVADGVSVMAASYRERRERLEQLELADEHWLTTAYHVGDGEELRGASRAKGLEGIVAKRLTSRYRPGTRCSEWLKLKNYEKGAFVVGGWLADPAGNVEALLVGRSDGAQLVYSGTVEFGLDGQRRQLREALGLIATRHRPFTGRPATSSARVRFVEPRLMASVRFIGWDAGVLREAILEQLSVP